MPAHLDAVIFDFDGVIANSEPLHFGAFRDVLARERVELTERVEPEGWHSERLFVSSIQVDANESPANHDGEVSGFMLFEPAEVVSRIAAGEFTEDAACAIAVAFSAAA